jgi:hypothetical protein
MPAPTELRYRIVCCELDGENETVILDATARAFIAGSGNLDDNGTMHRAGTDGGQLSLLYRIPATWATRRRDRSADAVVRQGLDRLPAAVATGTCSLLASRYRESHETGFPARVLDHRRGRAQGA